MASYKRDLRKLDILLLIFFPILATVLSIVFNTSYLVSELLFFGIPSLYLSYRTQKAILHSVIFSLPALVVGTLIVDHMAILNNAWHTTTLFPFRFFNTVPIDDLIGGFLIFYSVVIFYEHFFDKGKHKLVDSRMKYFVYLAVPSFTIFLLLVFTNSGLLKMDYLYLKGGIIGLLIPSIAFLFEFPKYISKFLKTAPYFFYLGLLDELTGLHLNQWSFPGKDFIGWVTIFNYRFPYEEFFFWLVISAISTLCFFEFFDDDRIWHRR